jgi:hypothetical protein
MSCGEFCEDVAILADAGEANEEQVASASTILANGPYLAALFAGDNNYEDGEASTIEANWAEFSGFVDAEKAFPALGNHDVDASPLGVPQTDKFSYLPGNKRYYQKSLHSEIDLFVLNSGKTSAGTLVEPDGNTVGSVQYNWFKQAYMNSKAKYRIVMFHHPYASAVSEGALRTSPEMDWGFSSLGVDLVIVGHTHTNEVLNDGGMPILNVSTSSRNPRPMSNSWAVSGKESVSISWADAGPGREGTNAVATLNLNQDRILVRIFNSHTGFLMHSFTINSKR